VGLVRQLSSLVVKAHPPLGKSRLSDLLAGGVARFHREHRLDAAVEMDVPIGELVLETNTEVFEEVLSKVLINAWEAYDNSPADPRPISLHARLIAPAPEGKFLEIQIDDRGRGIDPEIRDHLFEPFISTKHTVGVGMGLVVARHALRNLGGEVTLSDRPGGGASAVMRHPLGRRPSPEDAVFQAPDAPSAP
jgi:C4-dicarboxylate-specific signal transduction histidine kinase